MKILLLFAGILIVSSVCAQTEINPKVKPDRDKEFVVTELNKKFPIYQKVAKDIWSYAELGFLETQSAERLQGVLRSEGFTVKTGVSEMPTAFVATYGNGGPVIGILAEFDALPGLSQDSLPERKIIHEGAPGHACGHHLFGTASVAAAVTLKDWLIKNKKAGTVKLFGTPAEEGGSAKVYMVRDGLFNDVDVVLHWHPSSDNDASPESCLAIKQTIFRFYGRSAHAAAAPYAGRSALDGLEAMNYMVNLMREHVPQETRIHYVINKGGLAANVVPDYAEAEYMVRHPDARMVEEIWNRIVKAAEGAASGTETTMKYEVISGSFNLVPNETLSRLMYNNLRAVGGVMYTPEEVEFGKKIQSTLSTKYPPLETAAQVQPFKTGGFFPASTDVGDITWVVPTAGLGTATWVPGVPAHSWQAVATGGMSIGFKAMNNAAKTIAMTGIDIFNNPTVINKATKELADYVGPDFKYKSMIGDRKPPLDFRKGKQ
ncbi:MAG: amidohydrolase [Cyclobacteriaceae bacterium]|nr:amidohydrolase [Cyclobacteriaceae bacterium]